MIPGPLRQPDRRFAMNSGISSAPDDELSNPMNTVLFFESPSTRHDAADPVVSVPKDKLCRVVMFADTHGYSLHPSAVDCIRRQ